MRIFAYVDGRIDSVLSSDTVRGKEGDCFVCREASICHPSKNLVYGMPGCRYKAVGSGMRCVRSSREEPKAGSILAIGKAHCAGKMKTEQIVLVRSV